MVDKNNPALPAQLADFVGTWQLSRTIEQRDGARFLFVGEAHFTWRDTHLLYQEAGQVTAPNGNVMPAQRSYIWQQLAAGKFDVLFDDKRYFHSFSAETPNAEHLCGDDHYKVSYTFVSWPIWTSTWQVKGPRKDYEMRSRYVRS